jgi:hypothetical protein
VGRLLTPLAILLGFAMLSAALLFKDNDFESCLKRVDKIMPQKDQQYRDVQAVTHCAGR